MVALGATLFTVVSVDGFGAVEGTKPSFCGGWDL